MADKLAREGQAQGPRALGPSDAQEAEPFLGRWSRRKREARREVASADAPVQADTPLDSPDEVAALKEITDADLPPIESLGPDSDYRLFMAPKVGAELRRQALRKLFRQPRYNVRCELGEYLDDCSQFIPLDATLTHEMRARLEQAAQRVLTAAAQGLAAEGPHGQTGPDGAGVQPAQGEAKGEDT